MTIDTSQAVGRNRASIPGFISRLARTDFASGGVRALGTLRLRWQMLPARVRRNLCFKYMSQPAQAGLLPHFRKMLETSDFDARLAAMCVKLHAEQQRYTDAYQIIEDCLLKCITEMLSQPSEMLVKTELHRRASEIRLLTYLWRYLAIETKKDTTDSHGRRLSDEVEQLFTVMRQDCGPFIHGLPISEQEKFLEALLQLAQIADTERHVGTIYELFSQSSAKSDLGAYAKFISYLKYNVACARDLPEWERYLSEFKLWLDQQLPDEYACWELIARAQPPPRKPAKPRKPGKPPRPVKRPAPNLRIYHSLVNALVLAGRTELARRLAETALERAATLDLAVDLCSHFLRCDDDAIKLMAAKKLRTVYNDVPLTESHVWTFILAFLRLNDREHLLDLRRKGALDKLDSVSDAARIHLLTEDFGKIMTEVSRIRSESLVTFAENGDFRALMNVLNTQYDFEEFQFLQHTSAILNEVPPPRSPQGIAIVVAKNAHELNVCPILALRELKQRGFAILSLMSGVLEHQPTGIAEIDQIAGQLSQGMDFSNWEANVGDDWTKQWAVDHAAQKILYDGVNVYWGVMEDVGCQERRYSLDFNRPSSQALLADLMRRIETFELCLRRIADAGKRLNLPVRIVLPYVHLGTHYFARQYVRKLSESQDIALIHVSNAYENYFTNFAAEMSTTMAAQDMTQHDQLSVAYFAPAECFDRYYRALPNKEQLLGQVMERIKIQRIRREGGVESSGRLAFFRAERARGKKIVGLFGKVLMDLGMPRGDGPAHADMREWFDHTIAIARANGHLHLVIKPHPHEIRNEIALYPTEFLQDWLPPDLPGNIHFLGHDEFNLFELADVLDLALLWNSTSAVELGVLGIPTIIGAYQAAIDYPVGHILPPSRAHYEELIASRDKISVSPDVRLRSAALINYLRHPDISIPYRYTQRTLTNRSVRNLRWLREDLEAFYAHGDPNVAFLAARIAAARRVAA